MIAHPREILRPVIDRSGYAFAVLHNHPSGVPSPSDTDHALTRRLIESAEVLQLRFVDHVIVGAGWDYFSSCEAGIIGDGNTPATMRDKADLKIGSGEQSKQKDPLLALEDAVASTSGLLEALSCVLETSETGKYAPLSDRAVNGLRTLAFAQVEQLNRSFEGYHAAVNRGRKEAS